MALRLAIALVVAVSCSPSPSLTPTSIPSEAAEALYVPTWLPSDGPFPGADAIGRLSNVDGCVRFTSAGVDGLALWPPGYSATVGDNGRFGVLDERGVVVAVEGESIHVGGGEVDEDATADRLIGSRVRGDCRGQGYRMIVEFLE